VPRAARSEGWLPTQLCGYHAQLDPSRHAVVERHDFDDGGGWLLGLRGLALCAEGVVLWAKSFDDGDACGRRFSCWRRHASSPSNTFPPGVKTLSFLDVRW
jgi:hypothetical protein